MAVPLEFDHQLGERQPGHPEHRGGRSHAGGAEPGRQHAVVPEEQIDVGGVDAQPDEVRQGHAGLAEHGLQVVDAQRQLCRHVPVVPGLAVGVRRGLTGAEQGPGVSGDDLTLVEPHLHRPRHRIDGHSLNCHIDSIRLIENPCSENHFR